MFGEACNIFSEFSHNKSSCGFDSLNPIINSLKNITDDLWFILFTVNYQRASPEFEDYIQLLSVYSLYLVGEMRFMIVLSFQNIYDGLKWIVGWLFSQGTNEFKRAENMNYVINMFKQAFCFQYFDLAV